jgi:hypothetical protein
VEPEPLEVIRPPGRRALVVQGLVGLGFVVLFLSLPALGHRDASSSTAESCAEKCGSAGSTWILWLVVGIVALGAIWCLWAAWVAEIRIYRDALVLRRGPRMRRVAWSDMTSISLRQGIRAQRAMVPVITTVDGQRIELYEMSPTLGLPFWPRTDPAATDLVATVKIRIGKPVDLPDPPRRSAARTPLSGWFLALPLSVLALLLGAMTIAFASVPFTTTHGSVNPAEVPEGRFYYGYDTQTGGTRYEVECPAPVTSAFGNDPLCRSPGRSGLLIGPLGASICAALLSLEVVLVRRNRRKRRSRRHAVADRARAEETIGGERTGIV